MLPVWLCGTAALALFAGLAWYLAPLEPNVLVLQFAFTPRASLELPCLAAASCASAKWLLLLAYAATVVAAHARDDG